MIARFPYAELRFREDGQLEDARSLDALIKEVKDQNLTDLFVFSHGWNNTSAMAHKIYEEFFGEVRKLLEDQRYPRRRAATIGTVGVVWPSILWPEDDPSSSGGGAASMGSGGTDSDLFTELRKVFTSPEQQRVLDELAQLLDQQSDNLVDVERFRARLRDLIGASTASESSLDNLELQGVLYEGDDWTEMYEALGDQELSEISGGGAAGFRDRIANLWRGARGALRTATYWQMRERAGIVGRVGLGPVIGRLHQACPDIKVHLVGHSFGARLVSYALTSLPQPPLNGKSPVKSLLLLQGAFSHYAFAQQLPHDRNRSGDLAGVVSRVDGPLMATHSAKDLALANSYPIGSILAHQDAAATQEFVSERWGAMGYDGAKAVGAQEAQLGSAGASYNFQAGKWLNLDGNMVIVNGGPPSGAHSDIIHPHTAWAALAGAGILGN